jgi:hypothetical protein
VLPPYAPPPRRPITGLLAGLAGLVAAAFAIGGSFAPVHEATVTADGSTDTTVTSWWSLGRPGDLPDLGSPAGVVLVLATLLLGAGGVLAFTRLTTVARLVLALGVGVLGGAVVLQSMNTVTDMASWDEVALEPGQSIEFGPGWGMWLPVGGLVVGVVALVLAYRVSGVRVEPSTPRMGFPMPYGPMTGAQPVIVAPVPAGAGDPTPAVGAAPAGAVPVSTVTTSSTSDEDPETTLRTTVTESSPAASAPGAAAAMAAAAAPRPDGPAIANALEPGDPQAPSAASADSNWAEADSAPGQDAAAADGDAAPATDTDTDTGTEAQPVPASDSEGADPADSQPAAASPVEPADAPANGADSPAEANSAPDNGTTDPGANGSADPANSQPAAETPAEPPAAPDADPDADSADAGAPDADAASTEAPGAEPSESETEDDPNPGTSSVFDLPAAPPAPELAADNGNAGKD